MGTLIDTSVLIAVERQQLDLDQVAARNSRGELVLSAVTASELLHGLHRTISRAQRQARGTFIEAIVARFVVIPFDLNAARAHASLWADLARRGVSLGERDLMIGATAIANGHAIATRDQRSFPRIPGLQVEVI